MKNAIAQKKIKNDGTFTLFYNSKNQKWILTLLPNSPIPPIPPSLLLSSLMTMADSYLGRECSLI
jgi:hypothetical protein